MLINFCIIQMSSHVVFFWVVVDDGWLRIIVFVGAFNLIIQFVCPLAELCDGLRDFCFFVRILALCPVILVSNICPSNFIVKNVSLILSKYLRQLGFKFHLIVFGCELLLNLTFFFELNFFLFFLIEFHSAVEVCPVGRIAIDIECMSGDIEHSWRCIKISDKNRALWEI